MGLRSERSGKLRNFGPFAAHADNRRKPLCHLESVHVRDTPMTFDVDAALVSQFEHASVMFVHDDPQYAELFLANAERLGVKAAVTSNALKVIPALIKTRHKARLLVADLEMPAFDGLEIAKGLKSVGSPTKVLIVSSDTASKRALAAESLGFDVLPKPTFVAEFRALLAPVLENS
jgi:DNA-binding NtrC family response regulator